MEKYGKSKYGLKKTFLFLLIIHLLALLLIALWQTAEEIRENAKNKFLKITSQ